MDFFHHLGLKYNKTLIKHHILETASVTYPKVKHEGTYWVWLDR